jgi:phosphoribosylamine--glycine ligase
MRQAAVPTGDSRSFTDAEQAVAYSLGRGEPPVIKATGLAAGKGVVVPKTHKEAADAIRWMLDGRAFGDASRRVLIEEKLAGPEVSVFALTDGTGVYILDACQDHKRLLDGDEGPNTGGMGAFCPSTLLDDATMERVQREVLLPIIDSMRRLGIDYRGVIYTGLMLTAAGPKVLEFNARFGDPECQVLLPRLASDALEMLYATATGNVERLELAWHPGAAVCVVLASEGYPEKPVTGVPITGIEDAQAMEGVYVYHAGTKLDKASGEVLTAGGRVLGVTALGDSLEDARARAYEAAGRIHFKGMQLRHDIASAPGVAPRVVANRQG